MTKKKGKGLFATPFIRNPAKSIDIAKNYYMDDEIFHPVQKRH